VLHLSFAAVIVASIPRNNGRQRSEAQPSEHRDRVQLPSSPDASTNGRPLETSSQPPMCNQDLGREEHRRLPAVRAGYIGHHGRWWREYISSSHIDADKEMRCQQGSAC